MTVKTFAAIDVGSFELELGIFESQSWQRANTPHPPCLSKMSCAVPATGRS